MASARPERYQQIDPPRCWPLPDASDVAIEGDALVIRLAKIPEGLTLGDTVRVGGDRLRVRSIDGATIRVSMNSKMQHTLACLDLERASVDAKNVILNRVCTHGLEAGVEGYFAVQFVASLRGSQPALSEHQRGQQGVGFLDCLYHLRDQGMYDLTACLNGRPASWSWQADEATAGKIWCESLTETRPELSEDERVQQGAGYAACLRGLRKHGWLRSLLNHLARRYRRA